LPENQVLFRQIKIKWLKAGFKIRPVGLNFSPAGGGGGL